FLVKLSVKETDFKDKYIKYKFINWKTIKKDEEDFFVINSFIINSSTLKFEISESQDMGEDVSAETIDQLIELTELLGNWNEYKN
ncbi:168_t:CDS:1, partial [Gigaspora margarita]